MNTHIFRLVLTAAFAVWPLFSGCGSPRGDGHETASHDQTHAEVEHGEHEHQHEEAESTHGEEDSDGATGDATHDHTEHAEHGEQAPYLSPEGMGLAGIAIETAELRTLERTIELPGEIGFNEDRLAHVTPRYPGVAREVHVRIGAHVEEGDLLAVIESNESLSPYSIKAPLAGHIIEKHVTVGEFVAEDQDLFMIADLSTVWANCEVYAKDMPHVSQGAKVTITSVEGGPSVEAVISYLAPVYSEHTRSALARAALANNGELWRPGTFIRATLPVETGSLRLTVEKEAVQILGDRHVVFVPGEHEGEFEIIDVDTGMSGEHLVEILSGLDAGDAYVASGAFELKAKMVTASMGEHAGHGH
jgi:cobalt-zinc-cadmium efflux system membrane fusion protein